MSYPGTKSCSIGLSKQGKNTSVQLASQPSSSKESLQAKDTCISSYINLMRKKKPGESKGHTPRAKQLVLRSPSSRDSKPHDHNSLSEDNPIVLNLIKMRQEKENESKFTNLSKSNASKVLFHEELSSQLNTPENLQKDTNKVKPKNNFFQKPKKTSDSLHSNLFLNNETLISQRIGKDKSGAMFNNQEKSRQKFQFDRLHGPSRDSSKYAKDFSPKLSIQNSSPYCSPGHDTSYRSKSFARDSKVDLNICLDNFDGPLINVAKDVCVNEFCFDHLDKPSKYYSIDPIMTAEYPGYRLHRGFCSKCSVQMAMKGFSLEELFNQAEHERHFKISKFLEKLSNIQQSDDQRLIELDENIRQYGALFTQNILKAQDFYKRLIDHLKARKRETIEALSKDKSSVLDTLTEGKRILELKLDTVHAMRQDIENNFDKIISKIEEDPFRQIMSNYEASIQRLDRDIEGFLEVRPMKIYFNHDKAVESQRLIDSLCSVEPSESAAKDKIQINLEEIIEESGTENSPVNLKRGQSNSNEKCAPNRSNSLFQASLNDQKYYKLNYRLEAKDKKEDSPGDEANFPENPNRKKRKQKDMNIMSFDNRIALSKHKLASHIENEREHWKSLRENRQFMSMGAQNIGTSGDLNQASLKASSALKVSSATKRPPLKNNESDISVREIRSEKGKQMCRALQDSFEKEISRVKRSPEYNDTSSLFSNNTENDTTVKFITILDKINENQMKKNKFYSDIVKDMSPLLHSATGETNFATNRLDFDEAFRTLNHNKDAEEEHRSVNMSNDNHIIENHLTKLALQRQKRPSQHIDHILELHQPNQNEIIFECSKEWTVNQTPDMREKEMIPAHLAAHIEKMRLETRESRQDTQDDHFGSKKKYVINEEQSRRGKVDQLIASFDGPAIGGHPGKIYRLSCQKDLFGNSEDYN